MLYLFTISLDLSFELCLHMPLIIPDLNEK